MSQDIKSHDNYDKIIVELGSGDGKLLNNLGNLYDGDSVLLIGIEKDHSQYITSCKEIRNKNIQFINEPFESVLTNFNDNSLDTVLSVLPHPEYIDKANLKIWFPIYKTILDKMKIRGYFILVTELIDELLEPVSNSDYTSWKKWLIETFSLIGFNLFKIIDGAPSSPHFSSHYLNKFKNDPERIKIITLVLTK